MRPRLIPRFGAASLRATAFPGPRKRAAQSGQSRGEQDRRLSAIRRAGQGGLLSPRNRERQSNS
jgi:hypothetical protein